MLGLGSGLIYNEVLNRRISLTTTLLYTDALVSEDDDKILMLVFVDQATEDFISWPDAAYKRVSNLVANCTIVHTHGEDGADITDVSETVNLNCYRPLSGTSSVVLSLLDEAILSDVTDRQYALDLTAINSGSIEAVGDDNLYTFTLNYLSYPNANNSNSLSDVSSPLTVDAA